MMGYSFVYLHRLRCLMDQRVVRALTQGTMAAMALLLVISLSAFNTALQGFEPNPSITATILRILLLLVVPTVLALGFLEAWRAELNDFRGRFKNTQGGDKPPA